MKLEIDDLGVCGIIVADWDITKEFKPKTITTDYSTWITYISRRPVPAKTPITDTYYWKPIVRPYKDLANWIFDIKNQIESFLASGHGTAISTQFGNNNLVGISQKVLTTTINKIWDKIDSITGEISRGINMTVSPTFFTGDDGCTVTMTAATTEVAGQFDYIEFLINGQPFEGNSANGVETFACTTNIQKECNVTCNAIIFGVQYSVTKHISHNDMFWLGAGSTYADIFDDSHLIKLNNYKGNYDVNVSYGNYLFVIVPNNASDIFIRADLNGVEIEFTSTIETINNIEYKVYRSVNVYSAGIYNIDINS